MSPVSRSTPGGRAYLDLQRLARRTGRPTDEVLRTHVLDRFLWRVANSRLRDDLVLKGGLLLAALGARRPTADVDLLARGLPGDHASVAAMVAEVLAVPSDDGVAFATDRIDTSVIREGDRYPGVRVVVPATIDRAKAVLRVDVNIGDPVTPGPMTVRYPALLGEPFELTGSPVETVLAEKIATMLERGALTTRERDFADVHLLSGRFEVEGRMLVRALAATLAHRGSEPRDLEVALAGLGERRQANWTAFLGRAGLSADLTSSYQAVIEGIVDFAQPALDGRVDGATWNPTRRRWQADGP